MNTPPVRDTSAVFVPVSDLYFDLQNPRLPEFDLTTDSDDTDVIRLLWDVMDVKELVLSIAASGFFLHEPVIVTIEDSRHIVIEGNRRLAAVRILLDPELAKTLDANLPILSESARNDLTSVPVIFDTREGAWRYLGFKHVNGPAKWSSYAKSRYIAQVRERYGIPLADISRQIGDTHRTVQRLFRGLMVIRQAEEWEVFSRHNRWKRHFAFSHLYTGIGYPDIATFLRLRSEQEEERRPVDPDRATELGELCTWLYGDRRADIRPAIQRQNPHLRYLAAIVGNRDGFAALRSSLDVETAYEYTRPSASVFEASLHGAKRHLQKARGLLSNGYDGSEGLLRVADAVAILADDLYEEMARRRIPRRGRRREREG